MADEPVVNTDDEPDPDAESRQLEEVHNSVNDDGGSGKDVNSPTPEQDNPSTRQ